MASRQVISAAVGRALSSCAVDHDAPQHPRDERVGFDPADLAAVIRLCTSDQARTDVLGVVDDAMQAAIEALDQDRVLAAVLLKLRVEGATEHRLVVVENIEGHVGRGAEPS